MDRGAWQNAVHGVTELDTTEQPSMHTGTLGEFSATLSVHFDRES